MTKLGGCCWQSQQNNAAIYLFYKGLIGKRIHHTKSTDYSVNKNHRTNTKIRKLARSGTKTEPGFMVVRTDRGKQ